MTGAHPSPPDPHKPSVSALTVLSAGALTERIVSHDTSIWPLPNVADTRLGWTDIHHRLRDQAADIQEFASQAVAEKIVLIGMGGASLAAEVLRGAVGSDRLIVLDTTDPATIASIPTDNVLFLVASKSGATTEVRSLLAYAWELVPHGSRYVAITDPDTELATTASERHFAKVFLNDPQIGGRYSVLSYFGLVPAALLGYDIEALLDSAASIDPVAAVRLGIEIAHAALAGRDKLTIAIPERFAAFGLWVEQLIAESTGKRGVGVVPIPTSVIETGADRHPITVHLQQPSDLGGEFFRWQLATAAMGHVLGIDPFDEPNVAETKQRTTQLLNQLPTTPLPAVPTGSAQDVAPWLQSATKPHDYISIHAYLPYGSEARLEALRRRVSATTGLACTAGFAPRLLHSTGQLHKGGANNIVCVQIVADRPTAEVPVPGSDHDFHTLISAQSIADHQSLLDHDRRVLRISVDPTSSDPFADIC
jgi:hypothetical protein